MGASGINNDFLMGSASSQFRIVDAAYAVTLFQITNAGAATFSSSVTAATDISARNGDISIGVDSQFSAPYMALGFGGRTNAFNRIYAARDTTAGIVFSATTGAGFEFRTNGHATRAIVVESDGTFNLQRSASGANTTLQFRIAAGSPFFCKYELTVPDPSTTTKVPLVMCGCNLGPLSPQILQETHIVFSLGVGPYIFSVCATLKVQTVVSPTVFNSASLPTLPDTINLIIFFVI